MRSRTMTAAIISTAIAAALALAGCTGGGDAPSPSPTPTASGSPSDSPGVVDVTDTPGGGTDGAGGGFTGALADAPVTSCELQDGAWNVAGTATNPTEGAVTYRIYVSLLNGGGDTRALQQVDVPEVAAGETAEWQTSVPIDEDGLNCVLRVERYES